ncbi:MULTISPECIES: SpoIIE family protein phosphatase [unclassified Streptomyces]|uniref:SpoIIE family protein phosphatase n=1 Tax=unclassified Streptomyces TaxID=2593676 RepID=UPI00224FAEBA|nr:MULTISPECIES: SpoIIE family protein phosphatase [unclassified Streptomyces]MCX4878838.1 SpoIIE family protein phosphatase [Streptomyces sp. NBC_00847]MCX5418802.1 SpoIIE family protein phosphatase [Streptomyces sp. NBC_00078]
MPHDGRARAGVSQLRASGADAADTDALPPVPEAAAGERALAFAGAAMAAVYVPDAGRQELRLAETACWAPSDHRLPERLALSGGSPAACSVRTDRPLWRDPAEQASSEGGPVPGAEVPLGFLPLGTEGRRQGCLVVVGTSADGFEPEQRRFLKRYADAVTRMLVAAADAPGPSAVLGPALRSLRVGTFVLVPDTGLIEADETLLSLVGITPADFDGKADTLLAHALPEDMHALVSVLEPAPQAFGRRELEFRVRGPTGEMRWLSLSCRVVVSSDDRPEQVLGVVTPTSVLRRSADDVSRIQWLTAALDDATTVRDVSRVVVTALREPLGADRVALAELQGDRLMVTVLDPPQPDAWPETWRAQWRTEWPEAPISALPTLQLALRDGRPDLWPAGTDFEAGLAGIGGGGLAVLPLPARGRVAGLCLIGWDRPHEFVPDERSLLTATAALVGQALKGAHEHDAEQELATMLQRSLLPRRLPQLPGGTAVARYLPARRGLQVGGDWYDVIALSEDRVALVIGDVQGHSAGAATIMGQMRTAVRAYAVEGHPPDVVVAHANRLLVGMETDLFATCCYAELDLEQGNTLFVRAGHLAPLVRHPDGSTEEIDVEGGLPLGILEEAEFPMTAVELTPGTVLALLTDGLVEAAGLPIDEGMQQTRTALTAADPADLGRMADRLLGDVGRREDDVALLLMRYDGMRTRPIRAGWVVWRLPDAVMHARRFTARTLRHWKAEDVADAVLLVVSELVTNALVHTQGAVRLDLMLRGDRVRVCVSDSSPRAPAKPVIVDWESTGGRGLLLVEAMSENFGSMPVAGGKQVWSEIALPPREPAPAEPEPRPARGSLP